MNEAFVKNAEHNVNYKDRDQQQNSEPTQRRLERLCITLERGCDCLRKRAGEIVYLVDRLPNRNARLQIKRDGYGRELAQMIYAQGTKAFAKARDGTQRNQGSGTGPDIEK